MWRTPRKVLHLPAEERVCRGYTLHNRTTVLNNKRVLFVNSCMVNNAELITQECFSRGSTLRGLDQRLLAQEVSTFAADLRDHGYKDSTVRQKVRVAEHFGKWLCDRNISVWEMEDGVVAKFLGIKLSPEVRRVRDVALRQFLEHLHRQGVGAPHSSGQLDGGLLVDFRRYLAEERGLSQNTMNGYLVWIRRFLAANPCAGPSALQELDPRIIGRFVHHHAGVVSAGTLKSTVSALRCFFRFLRLRGDIDRDLAGAVPTVAYWRFSTLPKFLSREKIDKLLVSCDQSTATGRRDYAILLLLARLGLRSGEIVRLELDDIDWDAGELTIRAKDGREDRLPLPSDAGKALAEYIRHVRPSCSTRRVFVRRRAPIVALADHSAIRMIVCRALARAGISQPHGGPHMLRHSLATAMLRNGASLAQIAEILRHREPDTTRIYAKVDLEALRELAQPWPGSKT